MNHKMLYVTYFTKTNPIHIFKLEYYIKTHLSNYFDIIDIFSEEKEIDIEKYAIVLINSIIFFKGINPMPNHCLMKKIKHISRAKNVVLFFHDLHDYSINIDDKNLPMEIIKKVNDELLNEPILYESDAKKLYRNFFINNNIKYLISMYDCPEYRYFNKNFDCIKNFYLINHAYPKTIFKPLRVNKIYDILFYGSFSPMTYPLRCRLYEICKKSDLRIKFIDCKENICEDQLCVLINQSWACISCISNFSYFVRKYLEISACNAIVVGDINQQGFDIIRDNMIYVNKKMTDEYILEKIKYYFQNREIIAALSFNKLENIEKETYESMVNKLNEICDSILKNNKSTHLYSEYIDKNTIISTINHSKKIINITFQFNNEIMISKDKLNEGLYVCVLTNSNLVDIYDDFDKLLTRKDTYISDSKNPNLIYTSFKLNSESCIKIRPIVNSDEMIFYNIFCS